MLIEIWIKYGNIVLNYNTLMKHAKQKHKHTQIKYFSSHYGDSVWGH